MQHIVTKSGKNIYVFDDLIPLSERDHGYNYMRGSMFQIGWHDSSIEEHIRHAFWHSKYNDVDCDNLYLYHTIMKGAPGKLVEGLCQKKAVVNCATPADCNFIHAHPEKKVILYYANLIWNEGWHGETLFYDEAMKNIEFASPYTPGRVIVFDGGTPHAIRPQSYLASHFRFTFAMTFD